MSITYQQLAQQALDVQDACNLSGVVHAMSRGMEALWAEAHQHGHGTEWVNEHPIVTLFIDKLAHLNKSQQDLHGKVFAAYDRVHEAIRAVLHTA